MKIQVERGICAVVFVSRLLIVTFYSRLVKNRFKLV